MKRKLLIAVLLVIAIPLSFLFGRMSAPVPDPQPVIVDTSPTPEPTAEPTAEPTPEPAQETVYYESDLEDLVNLDNFSKNALEHIFLGSVNSKGNASGYHYDMIVDSPGEIVGDRSEPDEFGVYTAKIKVNGRSKSGNKGYSTFFPDHMSPQEVIDAINEAYENSSKKNGTVHGLTKDGMEIEMYIEKKKIVTAYPIMEED